jgi:hypothetical protein
MKKFVVTALLAAALTVLVAGTALAAGPIGPQADCCGTGPAGMRGRSADAGLQAGAMRRGMPQWAGQPGAVLELLGMTKEEIHAERQGGQSLAQIAQSKGITVESLVQAILDAKSEMLAKLVGEGKLTQDQANALTEQMRSKVQNMVERTEVGPDRSTQPKPRMGQGFRGARGAAAR